MSRLSDLHLVLYFSNNASLALWRETGMTDRETALYREIRPHVKRITFVSYGGFRDWLLARNLPGFHVVCNRFHLPKSLYRRYATRVAPLLWPRTTLLKSNQIAGADWPLAVHQAQGFPFIARCGYLHSDFRERESGVDSDRAKRARALERTVFQGATRGVVTTEAMRARVIRDYQLSPETVRCIPNYVQTQIFAPDPGISKVRGRILYVGRLNSQKNVASLVKALQGLDGVELQVIGHGEDEADLRALSAQLNVKAEFIGKIPHDQLPHWINAAEIVVLPSHYEGHPKTLLEAMSCGAPVIGADSPGIREEIRDGETGILVPPTPDELRQSIDNLIHNKQLQDRIGAAAREEIIGRVSLSCIVNKEMSLYEEVLCEMDAKPAS